MPTQQESESQQTSKKGKFPIIFSIYIFCSLADKIPNLIEKLKQEGKDDGAIRDALDEKKVLSVEKYGNKSKVGLILDMKNNQLLKNQKLLNNDNYLRKLKARNVSDFNRAKIQ